MNEVRRLLFSEDGVTSIEYALIAVLMAMAILSSVAAVGGSLGEAYQFIGDRVSKALQGG